MSYDFDDSIDEFLDDSIDDSVDPGPLDDLEELLCESCGSLYDHECKECIENDKAVKETGVVQWEYLTIDNMNLDDDCNATYRSIYQDELDALGRQGWELAGVTSTLQLIELDHYYDSENNQSLNGLNPVVLTEYIFKRPVGKYSKAP